MSSTRSKSNGNLLNVSLDKKLQPIEVGVDCYILKRIRN